MGGLCSTKNNKRIPVEQQVNVVVSVAVMQQRQYTKTENIHQTRTSALNLQIH